MFLLHLIDESLVLSSFFIVIILPLTCVPYNVVPLTNCNLGGNLNMMSSAEGRIPIRGYIPLVKISDREI
jgi:hypothetical protein